MKPNRVSYAAKYSVDVKAPNAHAVTCEFAWQAEDVVTREKGRRENMVDGASITKLRHGQPMERWVFDADEVVWRSVYTRNARTKQYVLVEYEFDRAAGKYKPEAEEPIRLQDFVDDNAHDEEIMDEMKRVHALPVGGEVKFGGGAAPLTAIRRVS
jgi:hypothetical protein